MLLFYILYCHAPCTVGSTSTCIHQHNVLSASSQSTAQHDFSHKKKSPSPSNHFYLVLFSSMVQWAAHQPTPMCQNFTMELEPYRIVIQLKIDQINLTVRGRLICTVQSAAKILDRSNQFEPIIHPDNFIEAARSVLLPSVKKYLQDSPVYILKHVSLMKQD